MNDEIMKLRKKIIALFHREKIDAEMAEEMRLHAEQRSRENIAGGMPAEEARYAARRSFGGVEQVKELAREQRGWVWMEQLIQDMRYAARSLRKAPGFTAVVVLTLALGIGATTAIYSVVNGVILHPVPGRDADRIVQMGEHVYYGRDTTPSRAGMSPPVIEALQANTDLFSDLAWADPDSGSFELKDEDNFVASISGIPVSANFFSLFNATPLLGRTFTPDEAVPQDLRTRLPARDSVIVLSYGGWQSLFGGDPRVLGQTIKLSGLQFTVIGVMPEWFQFPHRTQFWLPVELLRVPANQNLAGNAHVVARLKPGTSATEVKAMLATVAQRLSSDPARGWRWKRTGAPTGLTLWVQPLSEALTDVTFNSEAGEIRRTLFGLLAAIGFVLLIGCANVANLMLARTERRQHELAIRAALGAGRVRLMRQLLTESALLASLGGVGGLLVTTWGMKLLMALNTLPRLRPVAIDGHALGITLGVSLVTALIFGLVPAWRGARPRLNETLAQGGAVVTSARGGRRYRNILVVVQVSLAMVLLSGAALMIESVTRVLRVNPGYEVANLVAVVPQLPARARNADVPLAVRNQFYENIRERFTALPGVKAVGIWKNGDSTERIVLEGATQPVEVSRGGTGVEDADYFRVARVPLLAGRYLGQGDVGGKNGTVIVNESMARRCWPGESAVGKRFRTEGKNAESCEVVGVVRDTRSYSYDEVPKPGFYRPYQESSLTGFPIMLIVRAELDPSALVTALRRELSSIEPGMRTPYIAVAQQELYDATQPRRTYRNYLTVFAGLGLLLSALGLYGVLAYSVARRTREIGIRMAIGASRGAVLRMVMNEGVRLIIVGIITGLLASFWLTTFLEKQLFGVRPNDPAVLGSVVVVLSAVALVACWLPARRATKIDPMEALRCE